ncbi:MAG TPA: hypothetical protein VLE70_02825 [Anaerolineae bacterium]|jgi:hypothetical protein|nr:hypothetical protein [Anaerolineae bacterium]
MTSRGREQQAFVSHVADRIRQLGFRYPVLAVLEAGQPFAFVAGQMLWLSQPALALVMPREVLAQTAEMLEDPEAVSSLIRLLGEQRSEDARRARWTE